MNYPRQVNDSVHWFMGELSSRVVAESGIPSDRYHLGKLILQSLKDAPDFVAQVDGSTGESENNAAVLQRSIRCAISLRNFGLQYGDCIILMAPSHLDLIIPFYAALYLGVTISTVDKTLITQELKDTFNVCKPKLIFCQSDKSEDVQRALNGIELEAQIVTFDSGDHLNLPDFLKMYGDDTSIEDFKANDFDPEDTVAFFVWTSGSTGLPKSASITHVNFAITGPYWWSRYTNFPSPTRRALIATQLQWLTAIYHFTYSAIFRYTRIQSSATLTQEHAYHLINTYKPTYTFCSPTLLTTLVKPGDRDQCDFSCFELIMTGGSAVPAELYAEFKKIAPDTEVCDSYGMSELTSIAFHADYPPPGSCGKPMGCFQYRIIDIETQADITEPHVQGELWMKGPGIFKEYYNNPEATADTFAEGRWFKTGDIFYRDENWNFFFVERYKFLLQYRDFKISPVEVENVIRKHPGVSDVAVTGIPDHELGDIPVACVVKRLNHDVTADQIKDLVKESLSDAKQLRGGVIFLDQIPMTSTTKVHRRKLREIVLEMERE